MTLAQKKAETNLRWIKTGKNFHCLRIVCTCRTHLHNIKPVFDIHDFTKNLMQFRTWVTQDTLAIVANCKHYIYSSNTYPLREPEDNHESNLWSHSTKARKCKLKIRLDNACDRWKVAKQSEMHHVISGTVFLYRFLIHILPQLLL